MHFLRNLQDDVMEQNKRISKKHKENKSKGRGSDTGMKQKETQDALCKKPDHITQIGKKRIDRFKKYVSRGKQTGLDILPAVLPCGKIFKIVSHVL